MLNFIRLPRIALGLLASFVVVGCATSPAVKEQRREDLQSAVEEFHRAMEWEMIDKATQHVAVDFEENFRGRYEEYGDDLDIVGLRIKRVELGQSNAGAGGSASSARVEVKQRWYVEPDMSVNEEVYVELWRYGAAGWRLHDRLPRERWRDRQSETNEQTEESEGDDS